MGCLSKRVRITYQKNFRYLIYMFFSDLKEFLKQSPQIFCEDETTRILNAMEEDENVAVVGDEKTAVEFDESNRILYGTTSHLYIDAESMPRYTQFENHSYLQFRFLSVSYTVSGNF